MCFSPKVKIIFSSSAQYRKVLRKWVIASSSPGLRVLCPTSRRIMIFGPDGEWKHFEARRGHGPHGASRRRARSSAGRVRGRREVAVLVDRERRADKKCRSDRSGVRNRKYHYVITHCGSAPDHTRPEGVNRVGDHIMVQNIQHARGRRGLGPKGLRAG